jgi:hypothetical protein
VNVHVRYSGNGQAFVGLQRANAAGGSTCIRNPEPFTPTNARFVRAVKCGDSFTLRIPVRASEARFGPSTQVVMWAVEPPRARPSRSWVSHSRTIVRHEESDRFIFVRGQWRDPFGRRLSSPTVRFCL